METYILKQLLNRGIFQNKEYKYFSQEERKKVINIFKAYIKQLIKKLYLLEKVFYKRKNIPISKFDIDVIFTLQKKILDDEYILISNLLRCSRKAQWSKIDGGETFDFKYGECWSSTDGWTDLPFDFEYVINTCIGKNKEKKIYFIDITDEDIKFISKALPRSNIQELGLSFRYTPSFGSKGIEYIANVISKTKIHCLSIGNIHTDHSDFFVNKFRKSINILFSKARSGQSIYAY